MKLPNVSISFVWVVLTCGLITLLIIVGNLTILGLNRPTIPTPTEVNWTEFQKGRLLLDQYGCGGCHIVPGLSKARGRVGPSLKNIHEQMFIAGVVANNSSNLAQWIQNPQSLAPGTAMPNLEVTEEHSRLMANYLMTPPREGVADWLRALGSEREEKVTDPLRH